MAKIPSRRAIVGVLSRLADVPLAAYRQLSRDPRSRPELKRASADRVNAVLLSFMADASGLMLPIAVRAAMHSVKGFAADLLEQLPELQHDLSLTPHLGALSPISRVKATRMDYAALIMDTLLSIRKQHIGLGLGSTNVGISYGGRRLSGLELAQSWALILNWGHLFGTFATERNLLFELDASSQIRSEFVRGIHSKIRSPAERILDGRALHRFFYVLSAWRVSQLPDTPLRRCLIDILFAFFDDGGDAARADKARWAYRKARQIAYARLHNIMRIGVTLEQWVVDDVFNFLRQSPELGFDPAHEDETPVQALLDAFDAFHAEALFASQDAATLVLSHLRQFKKWWRQPRQSTVSLKERIDRLTHEPTDWPKPDGEELDHWVRMRLPSTGAGWIGEIRDWHANANAWHDCNFLFTPLPTSDRLLVDVYARGNLPAAAAHCVGSKLAALNVTTKPGDAKNGSRDLWRSVASYGLRLFRQCLKPGVIPTLEPTIIDGDRVGYAVIAPTLEMAVARLKGLVSLVADAAKRRELAAVAQAFEEMHPSGDAIWLVFLGAFRLLDAESTDPIQELDGVSVAITKTGQRWSVLEHKKMGQPGATGQIARLGDLLLVEADEPRRDRTVGGKTSATTFSST
jgi:hypothetical protein